jgi:FAD/FMN-containing dehydrogenase
VGDIRAASLERAQIELPEQVVDDFASRLTGQVLEPGNAGYEETRGVWNGMIDRRPALIARCAGEDDVIASVNFGRDNQLLISVRGGGHGVAGHAVCDGGLVVDLSEMRAVGVNPEERTARAGGCCTLGDLDGHTQRHGRRLPWAW